MDRLQVKKRLIFWYAIFWILFIAAIYLASTFYFANSGTTKSKWIGLIAGATAFMLASYKALEISFHSNKNPIFNKLTKYFSNGAYAFIKRLFKISLFFIVLISCATFKPLGLDFIICFAIGGISCFLSSCINIFAISKIATRSTQFFQESSSLAYRQMFNSGIIVAFSTISLVIIPLVILYHITKDYQILNGFALGAALVGLLNNVSSVVSKQAAASANNITSEVVADFAKNDKRNPLLLLTGVSKSILGANVLSCDLFVSFTIVIISAMSIGGETMALMGSFLPILIAASGIFACIFIVSITSFAVAKNPLKMLFTTNFFANLILVVISYHMFNHWFTPKEEFGSLATQLTFTVAIGAFSGFLLCLLQANFISNKFKPIKNVSNAAISGLIPTFKQSIGESFGGLFPLAVILTVGIISAFIVSGGLIDGAFGYYGVMLAILSALSTLGITVGFTSFGITVKNLDILLDTYEEDICERKNIPSEELGQTGYNISALGKNFINCVSILSVIACFITYCFLGGINEIDILNPYVLCSLFIGATIPFLFGARVLNIASKTARKLSFEVKKQIKQAPQILRYEIRPNFEKCCKIAAIYSSFQTALNGILIVGITAAIAYFMKKEAIGGFIVGSMLSSFCLLFMLTSSSNVVRGAKKYFENQYKNINNTEEYDSINISEAIFSSFKDLINPSVCAMIKFIAILILALFPMFNKGF